jgi:PTS system mannitol-specific IIC component
MGDVLPAEGVLLGQHAANKAEAIDQCGRLLIGLGGVEEPYLAAMHERELSISTYIGEEVAIPHGTDESRVHVRRATLGFIQYPDGVDWDGHKVTLCIPIASSGDQHLALLQSLAMILQESDQAERLRHAETPEEVLALLAPAEEEMSA